MGTKIILFCFALAVVIFALYSYKQFLAEGIVCRVKVGNFVVCGFQGLTKDLYEIKQGGRLFGINYLLTPILRPRPQDLQNTIVLARRIKKPLHWDSPISWKRIYEMVEVIEAKKPTT